MLSEKTNRPRSVLGSAPVHDGLRQSLPHAHVSEQVHRTRTRNGASSVQMRTQTNPASRLYRRRSFFRSGLNSKIRPFRRKTFCSVLSLQQVHNSDRFFLRRSLRLRLNVDDSFDVDGFHTEPVPCHDLRPNRFQHRALSVCNLFGYFCFKTNPDEF